MQMVQVRLSAKLCFSFNHIYPLGLFPVILAAGPLQPREVFSDKRIFSNVNITLASAHPDLEINEGRGGGTVIQTLR